MDTKVYWVLYNKSKRWHAAWAAKDTGKSVCGLINKGKSGSWDRVSNRKMVPACLNCSRRIQDNVRKGRR